MSDPVSVPGSKTTVHFLSTPPGAEVLDQDGKQVWYGTDDGLGSATWVDIGHVFVDGSLRFEVAGDEDKS